jgi:acylglycerol lipase
MKTDNLNWEEIATNVFISQFDSCSSLDNLSKNKIYVKKIESKIKSVDKKITVFLSHDIGQHHGRFKKFVDWTIENNSGVSFISMDFIGHGLSSGTRGHFDKIDYLAEDLFKLTQLLDKDEDGSEKWIILGHGLGGLVALDLMNRFEFRPKSKIDGLILSNFISNAEAPILNFEKKLENYSSIFKKLISKTRFIRHRPGVEVLTNGEDILQYELDPLIVHRPTLNSFKEISKRLKLVYQDSYFLDKPVMLLSSEVESSTLEYFSKGIKKELLSEKKYSLMKHDLYNETERMSVFNDIKNWMKNYEN